MAFKRDGMVIMMKGYIRMSTHKHVSSLVYMIKKVGIQMVMTRDDIVQIWIFEAPLLLVGGYHFLSLSPGLSLSLFSLT